MRQILMLGALLSLGFSSAYALNVEIQHMSTVFANQGMCSAKFDFVAYDFLENVKRIDFTLVAKDKKGKVQYVENLSSGAEDFNMVSGKTYGSIYMEGEEICGSDEWIIYIPKALIVYKNGKPALDIVKSKKLKFNDFKPMKIVIGK